MSDILFFRSLSTQYNLRAIEKNADWRMWFPRFECSCRMRSNSVRSQMSSMAVHDFQLLVLGFYDLQERVVFSCLGEC